MSPKKRSIFKEPTVIVAIITVVVGGVITGIFNLISKAMEGPVASITANPPLLADNDYAAQLLAEAQDWKLVAKDSFDSNKYEWPEGNSTGQYGDVTRTIVNGRYSLRVKAKVESAVFKFIPKNVDITPNFYLAVDVQNMNQLDGLGYGLTFRDQGASFNNYGFMIRPDQDFVIRIYNPSKNFKAPLAGQESKFILPFETNRITVIGIGHDFWFYVNDVNVFYLTDERFSTGGLGVSVAVDNVGDEGLVDFDNLEIRKAP
jgi:hypothetical protein